MVEPTRSAEADQARDAATEPVGIRRRHAVGVDLAWGETNPSGLAHLRETAEGHWQLAEVRTARSLDTIVAWLSNVIPPGAPVWVAVDAPIVAHNETGQRAADAALARDLRRFRCGTLPVAAPHAVRGHALWQALRERSGIEYRPPRLGVEGGLFETFPTAAQLSLLDLHRPIRYKHGLVGERQEGLRQMQLRLAMMEDAALPVQGKAWEAFLRTSPLALRGAALKDLEDRIDAVLAGLVAVLAWTAPGRLRTEGTIDDGFLTVPHLPVR